MEDNRNNEKGKEFFISGEREPLTDKEIKSCRHKSEVKWYRILVVLNVGIIAGILAAMIFRWSHNLVELKKSFADPEGTVISDEAQIYGMLFLLPIIFLCSVYYLYAKYKSFALKITPRNFPEIYNSVEEYSKILGLKEVPEAYILQENGLLNAFSAFILRKRYIQINADLFEIAYRQHKDMESLNFVIAHELSHIRLGHATFKYNLFILFSSLIPILSSTASRAREYSCDRLAQKVTGVSGLEPMMTLMVGKHLYRQVDIQDYLDHSYDIKGFFVWWYNLNATHPIMPKRMRALARGVGSGELY